MKKFSLAIALILAASISASAAKKSKKDKKDSKVELSTALDSASYALGMQVGGSLSQQLSQVPGGPINNSLFVEALRAALDKDTANYAISEKDINSVVQNFMKKEEEKRTAKTLAENKIFLEKNKQKPGVQVTASGLQYEVIKQGNGVKPKATDKVKVHYHGTLTDGTVFDSSLEKQPIEFELNKVIPGWTEGLQLMNVGSKFRFYIPSELGYGPRSMGVIKPHSILIFDVELLDVGTPKQVQQGFPFKPYQREQ